MSCYKEYDNNFIAALIFLEVNMVDILRPIIGKNRKEVLVVQFEGFMQNIIETFILKLKHIREIALHVYPKLSKYFNMDSYELYEVTMSMDFDNFFSDIGCGIIEDPCPNVDVNPIRMDTSFEIAISNLAAQDFIEEIHIVKNGAYSLYDIQYMREIIFPSCRDKVNYYEGDIYDVCSDLSQITTSIFLNDPNCLYRIFQNIPEDRKSLVMFFLRENSLCANYNFDILKDNKINYTKILIGPSDIIKVNDSYPMG